MSIYIDADELIKRFGFRFDVPTAEVQCKYCKHHGEATQSGMVYCPTIVGGLVPEDCFCAVWETNRRDDAG